MGTLDYVFKLFRSSTDAVPGEEIGNAVWGDKWPGSKNAFHNLINRINTQRQNAGQPGLISTEHYREELYPGEREDRKKASTAAQKRFDEGA